MGATRPRSIRGHRDGVVLAVVVTPRASSDAIISVGDEAVRIRLTTPPVDGKANAALSRFLAAILNVPKSSVEIIAGRSGRRKTILVRTDQAAEIVATHLLERV